MIGPGTSDADVGLQYLFIVCANISPVHIFSVVVQIKLPELGITTGAGSGGTGAFVGISIVLYEISGGGGGTTMGGKTEPLFSGKFGGIVGGTGKVQVIGAFDVAPSNVMVV